MSFRIHLTAKGCSRRGVQCRVLKPTELEQNELTAAQGLAKDATLGQYRVEVERLGRLMFIEQVTEPDAKDVSTAKWEKVESGILSLKWNEYFTTKDTAVLRDIFRREHGVSDQEVDDIMEKKVEVLAD